MHWSEIVLLGLGGAGGIYGTVKAVARALQALAVRREKRLALSAQADADDAASQRVTVETVRAWVDDLRRDMNALRTELEAERERADTCERRCQAIADELKSLRREIGRSIHPKG